MHVLTREDLPFLTADQMREVDRVMVDEFGILLIQMMENAGRALARFARDRFLVGTPGDPRVIVLTGTGGNGGGGLVAARRLHGWGVRVSVLLTRAPEEYGGVPGHQLDIVRRLGISVATADSTTRLPDAELIVDALIGYSLRRGAPHGATARLIEEVNVHSAAVLALDVPSGIDATTGAASAVSIRATATVTLALPKQGLRLARERVGELYLADIGVPPALYARPGLDLDVGPLFAQSDLVRIW